MCPVNHKHYKCASARMLLNAIPIVARAAFVDALGVELRPTHSRDAEVSRQLNLYALGDPPGSRLVDVIAEGWLSQMVPV